MSSNMPKEPDIAREIARVARENPTASVKRK
jgi:hypothetical protein